MNTKQLDTAKAEKMASELGHRMKWLRAGRHYMGDCEKCGRPAMVKVNDHGVDCVGSALLVTCQRVRKS